MTFITTTLDVWISHGKGKFSLSSSEDSYHLLTNICFGSYPPNLNESNFNTAIMCDKTGRHLVTMPHIERSTFQWNWANYPKGRKDEMSPWLEAFVNARKWINP